MKFGLKEVTIAQITGVFSHYPEMEKVILYGSRAKGNFKNGSDIDTVDLTEHMKRIGIVFYEKQVTDPLKKERL